MTEVNQMFGREDFRIAREAHYKRFLGEIDSVAHSMSVDLLPVHVDVYQLPPTGDRTYSTRNGSFRLTKRPGGSTAMLWHLRGLLRRADR